jgi:oligosaccharide repeat unit polymerase
MERIASEIKFHPLKLILSISFVLSLIVVMGIVDPFYQYIALSACILGVVIMPLWKTPKIDLFSIWFFVIFSVFLEVFLRAIYITFDIPNKDRIQQIFLFKEAKDFLINPYLLVILGVAALTLGFMVKLHKSDKVSIRNFKTDEWHTKRFWFVISALLILSWIGMYLILKNDKGAFYYGVSTNLEDYKSYAYARWLISFSYLAGFIIFVKILTSVRVRIFDFIILIILLGTYIFYSFQFQSRSGIAVILITMTAIYYYVKNKKIRFLPIIFFGYISLIVVRYMTYLRGGLSFKDVGFKGFDLLRLIEPLILTVSGFDISKTGHIVKAIPGLLDFQYGETIIRIIFLWIPRSIWPGKPLGVDTTISMKIFGNDVYGAGAIPPGFIAEMYLNFWIPGVIIGCFILGFILKRIHNYFKNNLNNKNCILLYTTSFMTIGSSFLGSGFCNTMVGFLMNLIPMYIIVNFLTKKGITTKVNFINKNGKH